MNRRPWFAVGGVGCALAATLWAASTQSFAAPSASASASANSSASAAPAAPPVEPVTLASLALPTERSALPKGSEWDSARPVRLDRRTKATGKCSAVVLREYMKVTCSVPMVGVRQFAGGIDDVQVVVLPKAKSQDIFTPPVGGYVVFPLRKGQGYVFRFFETDVGGYGGGLFPSDGPLVDAYWPAGDAAPTVTVR